MADMANDTVAVTWTVLLLMVVMTIVPIGDFGFKRSALIGRWIWVEPCSIE